MNEENGQHEFNFFLDKQIQQKLLEADDEVSAKEALICQSLSNPKQKSNGGFVVGNSAISSNAVSNSTNKNGNFSSSKQLKELQTFPICGWCANPAVVYRKTENDGVSKSKGTPGTSNRDSLLSREAKSKPHLPQEFVFRHFTDPRRYIEQYRREHICYDTANSSATKNEFLDSRRFYAYNQYSPLAVCTQNSVFQQSSTLPPPYQDLSFPKNADQPYTYMQRQPTAPVIHYTNRREQQRQTIQATLRSNNNKYRMSSTPSSKLDSTPVPEQQSDLSESSDSRDRAKRVDSAKESSSTTAVNGISVHKPPTNKMNLPPPLSARKAKSNPPGSPLDPTISNQLLGQKVGSMGNTASQARTLDTLACVGGSAGEKQSSGYPQTDDVGTQARLQSVGALSQQFPSPRPPQLHLTSVCEGDHWPPQAPPPWDRPEVSQDHSDPSPSSQPDRSPSQSHNRWDSNETREPRLLRLIPSPSNSQAEQTRTTQSAAITDPYDGPEQTQSNRRNARVEAQPHGQAHSRAKRQRSQRPRPVAVLVLNHHNTNTNSDSEHDLPKTQENPGLGWEAQAGASNGDEDADSKTSRRKRTRVKREADVDEEGSNPLPSWKERAMMRRAHTQQGGSHMASRWMVARKQEEKSLISHKRRIRHLIEQSRLKSRFGQILGHSSCTMPADRVILEISSLTISKPSGQLAPSQGDLDDNANKNDDSNPNNAINNSDGDSSTSPHDSGVVAVKKHALLGQDLLGHRHGNHASKQPVDLSAAMTALGANQNAGSSSPSENPQLRLDKTPLRSLDRLAEQLSGAVRVSMPRLKYSKRSAYSRSQTMNL